MPVFLEYEMDAMPRGGLDTGLMLFSEHGGTIQCECGAEIEGGCHTGGSSSLGSTRC